MTSLPYTQGEIKEQITENGTSLVQIHMTYPSFSQESNIPHLNTCIRKNASSLAKLYGFSLKTEAKQLMDFAPTSLPFTLTGKFTLLQNNEIISYYQDVEVFAGGLRPITQRFAHNFISHAQKPIFLSQLFPEGTNLPLHIPEKIIEHASYEWVFGKYKSLVEYFSPERFYLGPQGLSVFYPLHTLAVPAMGIPVFTLPYCKTHGPFPFPV